MWHTIMLAQRKNHAIIITVRQTSIKTVHFKQGFPKALSTPKIVLHLPPPRVNGDNANTSCVFSNNTLSPVTLLFLENRSMKMIKLLKKTETPKPRVVMLPLYVIAPNPNQPRKYFEPDSMEELKESIIEYGLIQPITVRRAGGQYELVAGERRFRAAQMAGLTEIPAIVVNADNDKSAILALLENLQREDLSFFEVAESYKSLIGKQGLTQTELAERVGKSQSSVANKIRLLRLPPLVKKLIRDYDLSERHARALLMLTDEEKQLEAVKAICRDNLNVAQTEELIRKLNSRREKPLTPLAEMRITKANDVKVFKNTVTKAVDMMKKSGIEANIEENAFDWGTEYIIKIKK